MFDSRFISCPTIGFTHLLEIATREFNAVNGHPQYDVHYPMSKPTLTDEELEIVHEMEDQDGCQAWKNDAGGTVCMCIDCMEECERDFDQQCIDEDDSMFDTIAEARDFYSEIY